MSKLKNVFCLIFILGLYYTACCMQLLHKQEPVSNLEQQFENICVGTKERCHLLSWLMEVPGPINNILKMHDYGCEEVFLGKKDELCHLLDQFIALCDLFFTTHVQMPKSWKSDERTYYFSRKERIEAVALKYDLISFKERLLKLYQTLEIANDV